MKRRDAVKGILLFSLGTGVIYSCIDEHQVIRDLGLKYFSPKNEELDIIATLSDIIVPIHAIKELKNHTPLPLMFTMLDDVYNPRDRALFLEGYQNFDEYTLRLKGEKFSDMKREDQILWVEKLNQREEGIDSNIQSFFDIVKVESIRYFKTSEYYQRKVNYYEMAPGRFKGSVLMSELQNANDI